MLKLTPFWSSDQWTCTTFAFGGEFCGHSDGMPPHHFSWERIPVAGGRGPRQVPSSNILWAIVDFRQANAISHTAKRLSEAILLSWMSFGIWKFIARVLRIVSGFSLIACYKYPIEFERLAWLHKRAYECFLFAHLLLCKSKKRKELFWY